MHPFGRDPRERAAAELRRELQNQRDALRQTQDELRRTQQFQFQGTRVTSESVEQMRVHEEHYANTIMLIGYGGFFALWSTTSAHAPAWLYATCGGLMAVSLLFFVGFELCKTIGYSLVLSRASRTDDKGHKLHHEHQIIKMASDRIDAINARWLWAFAPAAATGLTAGFLLLGHFIYVGATNP